VDQSARASQQAEACTGATSICLHACSGAAKHTDY